MRKAKGVLRLLAVLMAGVVFFSSCKSTTIIRTVPDDAKLYMNEEYVGQTPYVHSDKKIVGVKTRILIEKEGYKDFETVMKRNEKADAWAIVLGVFLLVPFLWVTKYKPERTYDLKKSQELNE